MWGEEQERKSRSKQQVSERPEVIPDISIPPDVPSVSNGSHAAQNDHHRSPDVTWSSSSDVGREKFTNRRDTRISTSKTHQELETTTASDRIEVKAVCASQDSNVKREKSDTSSSNHQQHFTSGSSRDGAHTDSPDNAVVTSLNNIATGGIKPGASNQGLFTPEIPCSTVSLGKIFKSSSNFLFAHCELKRRM